MKYHKYNNGSYYFLAGMLLIVLFGGFSLLITLTSVIIALFFNLLPIIILVFLFRLIFKNSRLRSVVNEGTVDRARFVELLIGILAHIIKADGKVDPRELDVVRQFFQMNLSFGPRKMMWVNDLLNDALASTHSLDELCQEFNQQFDRNTKLILLQILYRISLADGTLSQSEQTLISNIVTKLAISQADHDQVRALFNISTTKENDYYEILGVSKHASKEDIKAAYKKLIKEHHPDKVHHLGPEFRKVAEEKMKKINLAYKSLST